MSGSTEIRRLLRNLFPLSYDLHICPDLDKLTFTGNVVVELNVERDTTEIRLHSLDLQIPGVKVGMKIKSFRQNDLNRFNFNSILIEVNALQKQF